MSYTHLSLFTLFHPELHPIFETLGYAGGYGVYRRTRKQQGDLLNDERRWMVIAATAVGALLGSRALGLLEQAPSRGLAWHDLLLPGGKTIIGGLLGGWLAVEIVKRVTGIRSRTGDLFAVPLCIGIAIGRIGCFLAGLADDTYGKPTSLPWGIDFGDGIRRHPTQLYEVLFLAVLGWLLWRWNGRPHSPQAQATTLRELLCCLPQVHAPQLGYNNLFRILIVAFIDAQSFDLRSIKKTCVHIAHPDGKRLIPFDTYNMFYRDDLEQTRLEPLRERTLASV